MPFHDNTIDLNNNPLTKSIFIEHFEEELVVPGSSEFLITQDGKYIETQDGKSIITST